MKTADDDQLADLMFDYKEFLSNLITVECTEILETEELLQWGVDQNDKLLVLDGWHILPKLLGYRGPPSNYRQYIVYLFKSPSSKKRFKKVIQCCF